MLDSCSIFSASPKAFHSAYWVPRCRNFRARLAKENGTWQRQDLCTELDVQQQVVAPRNKLQQREAKILADMTNIETTIPFVSGLRV